MLPVALLPLFCTLGAALDGRFALREVVEKHRFFSAILENEFDGFTSPSNGRQFGIHDILSVISQLSTLDEVSQECKEDLEMIVKTLAKPTSYSGFIKSALAPMFDSSGKKGPAILRAHIYFAGHYSECKAIDYVVEGRDRHFQGEYFRVWLDPFFRPNSRNDSCSFEIPLLPDMDIFWQVGLCLPASCSSADLLNLVKPETGSEIDNPVCRMMRPGDLTPEIDAGFYITLSIMGAIAVVCIASGLVDFYFSEQLKNPSLSKKLSWRLFLSCSLYSNISSIFDVSDASKEGQIGPIHCIRFFSMVWVLLSHLFQNYLAIIANPADAAVLARDLTSEAITNGYFAVDSFFFISGALLTFLWFKSFKRQPKATNSAYGWTMFYVHRILRLSPAFYVLVVFYTFVLKQLLRDTPLSINENVVSDSCSSTWWVEFLYVHNWVYPRNQCLGYSWYLAADMQIFMFTPLIIIPLAIKPILGLLAAAALFTISTAANIFLVYHNHWPAGGNWFHPADPEQTNYGDYNMLMYEDPLIRCQIYIMGMVVGWLLQSKKQLKIHPIMYLSCWVIGLSLMLTILLGLHDQTNGTEISLFWRAMYSSLSRPAWGLGLSAIVVLCYYGYGGPINAFMSWHIWLPLGRLSYCAYLIHIPVLQLVLSQTMDEVYFSNFTEFFITRLVSITAVTFFFATFWSACFELSFGRMEKILLGGLRAPKTSDSAETKTKENNWEIEAATDSLSVEKCRL